MKFKGRKIPIEKSNGRILWYGTEALKIAYAKGIEDSIKIIDEIWGDSWPNYKEKLKAKLRELL